MTTATDRVPAPGPGRRSTSPRFLPAAWLAASAAWAAVIVVTDRPAWPLTIWIATTIGPLTAVHRRHRLDAPTAEEATGA